MKTATILGLALACGACAAPSLKKSEHLSIALENYLSQEDSLAVYREGLREAIEKADPAFVQKKLSKSPYRLFRFAGAQSRDAVCIDMGIGFIDAPRVNLHGDPHLTQFVVTKNNYGLDDFDGAGSGPAAIDLVRYATSLWVFTKSVPDRGFQGRQVVEAFFDSYQKNLSAKTSSKAPALVARLRKKPQKSPEEFLVWAEGLMQAADIDIKTYDDTGAWDILIAYAKQLAIPDPENYLKVKKIGLLHTGVGSALDEKYLLRIEGPSERPEDDLIVEAKVQTSFLDTLCTTGGLFRSLLVSGRMGRLKPTLNTYIPLQNPQGNEGVAVWVKSWQPSYRELSFEDIQSQQDLVELAEDAGAQLAMGHVQSIAVPHTYYLRVILRRWFDKNRHYLYALAKGLAEENVKMWEEYFSRPQR